MFILRPDVTEEDADKLIAGFTATIVGGGGSVKTVEKMGRRKLAYTVRKFNDGNYVLLTVESDGSVVAELERRLRVTEPVIKFLTVRIDEEEKRLAKVKAARGVRRKPNTEPATAVAAQAAPVAAVAPPVAAAPAPVATPVAAPAAEAAAEALPASA
jgi:small subunit ribosomal protein S6